MFGYLFYHICRLPSNPPADPLDARLSPAYRPQPVDCLPLQPHPPANPHASACCCLPAASLLIKSVCQMPCCAPKVFAFFRFFAVWQKICAIPGPFFCQMPCRAPKVFAFCHFFAVWQKSVALRTQKTETRSLTACFCALGNTRTPETGRKCCLAAAKNRNAFAIGMFLLFGQHPGPRNRAKVLPCGC